MRNIPGWPEDTAATEPVFRVSHGGQDREVNSFSITRALPSSFHAQVRGVGGLKQATGEVTWSALSDVSELSQTPFNRQGDWPPRTRDAVSVWTGYRTATGDLLAKQLTGFISRSSGEPRNPTSSGLVDPIARLSQRVTLPPLQPVMPPLTPGGAWRNIALYPTFFTDLCARAGRFFSTPPMSSGNFLSAPLMGSAWPEQGTVVDAYGNTDTTTWPQFHETGWGLAAADCRLNYTPVGGSELTSTHELTAMFEVSSGEAHVSVAWGGAQVRLWRSASSLQLIVIDGGTSTVAAAISAPANGVCAARVTPSGSTLSVVLRDGFGKQATGTVTKPAAITGAADQVRVLSSTSGAKIGGVQTSRPNAGTEFQPLNYTRSAYITPAAYSASFKASPAIIGRTAGDLLEEQSTAELAGMWIDGDGALRWVNRGRLLGGGSVATLTSRDSIKSLGWEEDFTGVASRVEVSARMPEAVMRRKYPQVEVWRSNYSKVEANGTESFEELIHPDADEDWIMVDTSFNNTDTDSNNMRGSDVALYYFLEEGTSGEVGYATVEAYSRDWAGATLQRVDHRTYKLNTEVYAVGTSGFTEREFSLQIPSQHQSPGARGGWGSNLGGMNFPVIRAYAKTMWVDKTFTAEAGAWDAPVLGHDVGWWVQDDAAIQSIADFIAADTTAPTPTLSGVSVVPDARIERGDVITLRDDHLTRLQWKCLVTGIEDAFTADPIKWSQTYDLRILSTTVL